jgi:hypothetical protein
MRKWRERFERGSSGKKLKWHSDLGEGDQMKTMIRSGLRVGVVTCVVALAYVSAAVAQDRDSGFLRDYTRLEAGKDSKGVPIRNWVSPRFTPANYNALLLEPIVFYPEPQAGEKVSAAELQRMLAYANEAHKQAVSKRFTLVDRPGPGVVRLRLAFTSVATKEEGLKPYQLVPLAFVATMASRAATGGAPQRALIIVEAEATDSTTGELLGLRVRVGTGERLAREANVDVVTLDAVKPILDELAEDAFEELPTYLKGR